MRTTTLGVALLTTLLGCNGAGVPIGDTGSSSDGAVGGSNQQLAIYRLTADIVSDSTEPPATPISPSDVAVIRSAKGASIPLPNFRVDPNLGPGEGRIDILTGALAGMGMTPLCGATWLLGIDGLDQSPQSLPLAFDGTVTMTWRGVTKQNAGCVLDWPTADGTTVAHVHYSLENACPDGCTAVSVDAPTDGGAIHEGCGC